jgi:hypothetical protein
LASPYWREPYPKRFWHRDIWRESKPYLIFSNLTHQLGPIFAEDVEKDILTLQVLSPLTSKEGTKACCRNLYQHPPLQNICQITSLMLSTA